MALGIPEQLADEVVRGGAAILIAIGIRRAGLFGELEQTLGKFRNQLQPGEWATVNQILGELRIAETGAAVVRDELMKLLSETTVTARPPAA